MRGSGVSVNGILSLPPILVTYTTTRTSTVVEGAEVEDPMSINHKYMRDKLMTYVSILPWTWSTLFDVQLLGMYVS